MVKGDGGGRDWCMGDRKWENEGTSMHRGGILGEGLEVLGTREVHCGTLACRLDGVLGPGRG